MPDFIDILGTRIRKACISAYATSAEDADVVVIVTTFGSTIKFRYRDSREAQQAVQRIDYLLGQSLTNFINKN